MSGVRKTDHIERRKVALMRRADTEAGATHNIGGVKKREQRRKPSLPPTPWDVEPKRLPDPVGGALRQGERS